MEILTGTKREITTKLWYEQIEKHIKTANDSMECFKRHGDIDSLIFLVEDCEKVIANAKHAIEAIELMDNAGIK